MNMTIDDIFAAIEAAPRADKVGVAEDLLKVEDCVVHFRQGRSDCHSSLSFSRAAAARS